MFEAGWEFLKNGSAVPAIWVSFKRVFWGTLWGVSIGVAIAVAAGLTGRGDDLLDPTMQVVKAVPKYTLVPLFHHLARHRRGTEDPAHSAGHRDACLRQHVLRDPGRRPAARGRGPIGGTPLGRARAPRGVARCAPGFFSGLRISLANAWLALIVVEQYNAPTGLGTLMNESRNRFRVDQIMFIVVVYAVLGLLSLAFVRLLERRFLQWREGFQGE